MTGNPLFILQAGIGAGIFLLILNIAIIIIGLPAFTIILANKYERIKLALQPGLTTLELFLVILKAFVFSILITSGIVIIINLLFYLVTDLSLS